MALPVQADIIYNQAKIKSQKVVSFDNFKHDIGLPCNVGVHGNHIRLVARQGGAITYKGVSLGENGTWNGDEEGIVIGKELTFYLLFRFSVHFSEITETNLLSIYYIISITYTILL